MTVIISQRTVEVDFGRVRLARKEHPILNLEQLLEIVQQRLPSRCSETCSCLANRPDWFRELGCQEGVASLERRLAHTVPHSLRLFYQLPATACWLLSHADTDVFLEDWPPSECPGVVEWHDHPHLVIAELRQSQLVIAVELNGDNPRIEWGDYGAKRPLDYPAQYFTPWLSGVAEQIIDELKLEGSAS